MFRPALSMLGPNFSTLGPADVGANLLSDSSICCLEDY